MAKKEGEPAGKLVSEGKRERDCGFDPQAAQQEEHAETGNNAAKDEVPVVGEFEREKKVTREADGIGAIDVCICKQGTAAICVRIPPWNFAISIGIVDGVLKRQIVIELINNVMILWDAIRLWIHVFEMLQEIRADIERGK